MDGPQNQNVEAVIAEIKARMPGVYQAIRDKAEDLGPQAYRLVRQGLRGEPNRFYAMEGGRVVGTPFDQHTSAEVAQRMVRFGCSFICIWPLEA